jgi:hypothetical protein
MPRVTDFLRTLSGAETPTSSPMASRIRIASATPIATQEAEETPKHSGRKTARQARAASENAAAASKAAATASTEAAIASRQAATASKQAASIAEQVEGSGHGADVSLEANPGAGTAGTPATPSAATSIVSLPPAAAGTPTLSSPVLESSGSSGDANPAKAAKLVQDVDKIAERVDRKNLSADDSQRDILARKFLQEAKKSLAERDSGAAISLATKASTLLKPLPKLVDSAGPSAP